MAQSNPQSNAQPDPEQVLRKALLRVAASYELSRRELCAILGMSEATISRFYHGDSLIDPNSKQGELVLLLLRLYRSLNALLGDNDQQAQQWLRSYNHYLQAVPVEYIKDIAGLIATLNYLDAMRGKL